MTAAAPPARGSPALPRHPGQPLRGTAPRYLERPMASVRSQPPSRNHRLTPGDVRSSGSVFGQSAESGGSSAWAGSGGRHQATKWARQSTGPAFRGSGSSSLRFPPKALFRSLYEVAYTCRELILGGESGRGRGREREGGGRREGRGGGRGGGRLSRSIGQWKLQLQAER